MHVYKFRTFDQASEYIELIKPMYEKQSYIFPFVNSEFFYFTLHMLIHTRHDKMT